MKINTYENIYQRFAEGLEMWNKLLDLMLQTKTIFQNFAIM